MNLQANNYYILASSQLFPFTIALEPKSGNNESLMLAKKIYALVKVNEKKYDDAIVEYTKAIALYPDQPFFYACRSILHKFNGDDESSFYDYQIAKRFDFNYHHYLEWLENQGEMIESEDLLELDKNISTKADNAQLYLNRAMVQVQHFNYAEALSDYSKAFVIDNNINILVSRAAIYLQVLQYDKALADLNLVIDAAESVDAYLYRAKLFISIKEYDKALDDLDLAISLDSLNIALYEEKAQLFEQVEQYDMAIVNYSKIIELNSTDFYPYVLRADAYEKKVDWPSAISDYSEAIRLNPYYSDLYQYRGLLRERSGDSVGAKDDFSKYEELEEED
ncbi:tetratricopeptide repeat protein [Sphingobacterium bovistauri]|uniref:Tetratricopeptide repeat-containing protein n=1 Tax=Sphingobacterium bovistauri TaxID=2781959 RepID=A0ABS7Z7F6_9SPHI|nr:hypothetical protein [Sphingobacterium bovistauri]MCA5004884.1 hypothetical protein [Sphingobacterium bovistauri]